MPKKKVHQEQQYLVGEMTLWLTRKYSRWLREKGSELNRAISQLFAPATEQDISVLFRETQGELSNMGKFLFLPPPENDGAILPVAALRFDFQRTVPELRIQVGLFTGTPDSPRAIGVRFETPEGTGAHNYYHCQLFRHYANTGRDTPLPIDHWLPTGDPTLPLGAKNSVALMVCLIASLYGRPAVEKLALEPFGNQMKRYMDLVPWVESKATGKRHQEDEYGRWHCSV